MHSTSFGCNSLLLTLQYWKINFKIYNFYKIGGVTLQKISNPNTDYLQNLYIICLKSGEELKKKRTSRSEGNIWRTE